MDIKKLIDEVFSIDEENVGFMTILGLNDDPDIKKYFQQKRISYNISTRNNNATLNISDSSIDFIDNYVEASKKHLENLKIKDDAKKTFYNYIENVRTSRKLTIYNNSVVSDSFSGQALKTITEIINMLENKLKKLSSKKIPLDIEISER